MIREHREGEERGGRQRTAVRSASSPGCPLIPDLLHTGQGVRICCKMSGLQGVPAPARSPDVLTTCLGYPFLAEPSQKVAAAGNWALTQVVATELPPARILQAVRDEVADWDPELVTDNAAPMTEVVGRGVSRGRFALVLMSAFAAGASTLAALGVYGVLAYTVRLRTQEIGIRIALGATVARVRAMVLRQAAFVVGIGLVAGIAGALVLGRWLSSLVFEISPWDPRILVVTTVLLTIIALLSAPLPARRASRVEPRIALLEE